MKVLPLLAPAAPVERVLATATVAHVDDGIVHVTIGDADAVVARLALPPGASPPALSAGTSVVVLLEGDAAPVIVSAIVDRLPTGPAVVEIDAPQHLVLRCGNASIELFADGTIQIHGERIDSEAEGIQRIKGAQVRIN
jgi:hypothetical protein